MPKPTPEFYCPTCAKPVPDPLVCGDCSAVICRVCGKTADVDCTVGHAPCLTFADGSDYQIDEAEVVFWGTCPDCLAAKKVSAHRSPKESSNDRDSA